VTLHEVEERKPLEPKTLISREAELLSRAIPRGAFVVALDKSGKSFSSRSFAQLFQDWINEKRKFITFVIGGPEGLDNTILSEVDLKLNMGDQTWPHLLVRCMLLEQIYRAQCILTNHPYHR
jgi:23S rRNA (pseudouridine1915-N3)-methyltransferase